MAWSFGPWEATSKPECVYLGLTADVNAESPVKELVPMYVPRDEAYEELKKETIAAGKRKGQLNNLAPWRKDVSTDNAAIQTFSEI
ncbi:Uncharacterized protein TCM_029864 [Theobroma cacao]|uniref:Lipoxygenase domain-containing protein n=1 Tax=Theobroma cacao TaxID=3641 RepID=A0A061GFQ8_THECC|nr:Uncharacterized protein TCM_029864 [Theobroma cacao]